MHCIFCQIIDRAVPAKEVYRDEKVIALEDARAQAPVHVLVVPVKHYQTIDEVCAQDPESAHELVRTAARLGRELGGDRGFRIVVNTGEDGGQTVPHVHLHVLAGRAMSWPPG